MKKLLYNPSFIFAIYILVAAIAVIVKISIDLKPHDIGYISKINNFIIYRNSFYHLIQHINLYGYHPAEQYDEFLYSPAFALLIAPFALLPTYVGVIAWCVFNGGILFYAVRKLPVSDNKKVFIHWFILIDLITAIQNVQVNPLICALFLFAFIAFERQQLLLAALCIALSGFIKVYGLLGASLFLLYPDRIKFICYMILWSIILFFLPVVFISIDELFTLYKNWFHALSIDHQKNTEDISIMKTIAAFRGIAFTEQTRLLIQLAAVIIFCIKYLRTSSYSSQKFRFFFLSSAMIWCIIFNHAAESATYIIAITGVAIWYTQEEKSRWNLALLILAFILCSLSPTDIFPKNIRHNYIVPYALKALPCFIIWIKLEYEMIFHPTKLS